MVRKTFVQNTNINNKQYNIFAGNKLQKYTI